ncbi:MAG: ion transporter [Planctomycetes bacterium]|nr:ion transporter [Planctomycetota bacterium]
MRRRIHEVLDPDGPTSRASRGLDSFMMGLITLNVVALVLESMAELHARWTTAFRAFEYLSVGIFSIEYVLRLWTCAESPRWAGAVLGRLRYARTPLALIDLLAVLPFYLPFLGVDLRFVRALRLFRLFRILKLARYSTALKSMGLAFTSRREELLTTLYVLFLVLLFASALMYYAEHEAQPKAFSSIPAAMWWGIATVTTVGYGDIYPTTPEGKVVAGLVAILGIAMIALPTGVLGAAFTEQFQHGPKAPAPAPAPTPLDPPAPAAALASEPGRCPHCGRELPGA